MKRKLWLLVSLLTCLMSCNNEDIEKAGPSSAKNMETSPTHFYGVKRANDVETRGVAQKTNLWYNGSIINVKFLNDPYQMKEKVKEYAAEWEKHANIKFNFVEEGKAEIRIGFDWNDDRWITWSYIGTDCKSERNQEEATMSFAYLDTSSEEEIKGNVLRAFGSALGLELEHRHLDFDAGWTNRISTYWDGEMGDIPWEDLKEYVFDPIADNKIVQTDQYDENSIMIWPFSSRYAKNTARSFNYELSEQDIEFIKQLYPKPEVVDDGATSFEVLVRPGKKFIIDFSKVLVTTNQLSISQDGISIYTGAGDKSPKVELVEGIYKFRIKGEQYSFIAPQSDRIGIGSKSYFEEDGLVNFHFGEAIFDNLSFTHLVILKDITFDTTPKIHTRILHELFYGCTKLASIPKGIFDDTPKNVLLRQTFRGCASLTEIPEGLFDKVIIDGGFRGTFQGCSSLTTIPKDLFKYNNTIISSFDLFKDCTNLTSIPEGLFDSWEELQWFDGTFYGCGKLQSVPKGLLDKLTLIRSIDQFFWGCESLASIPEGFFDNNTNLENFSEVFVLCKSLTTVPEELFQKNTKATNFYAAFRVSGLTNIPPGLFKNSRGKYFKETFSGTPVASIPQDLFKDCRSMVSAGYLFYGCTSLTEIPEGLFDNNPNVESFYRAFYGCTSLTDIPEQLFKNCIKSEIDFSLTFFACTSVTSKVPELWKFALKGTECYKNCTLAANYNDIPSNWK